MADDFDKQMQEFRARQRLQYLQQQAQEQSHRGDRHTTPAPQGDPMVCDPAVEDGLTEPQSWGTQQEREPWLDEDAELARRLQEEEDAIAEASVRPPMRTSDQPERLAGAGVSATEHDSTPHSHGWVATGTGLADSVRRWWAGDERRAPQRELESLSQEEQDAALARQLQEEESEVAVQPGPPQTHADPGIPSFAELFRGMANPQAGSARFQMRTGGTFSFSSTSGPAHQTIIFQHGPNGTVQRVISGTEGFDSGAVPFGPDGFPETAGFGPLFFPPMGAPFPFADPVDNMSYEQLLALQDRLGHVPKGATAEQIEALPVSAYSAPVSSERNPETQQCNVCLEEFTAGALLRTLPCLHRFHVDCIDRWLPTNRSCPICKVEVTA